MGRIRPGGHAVPGSPVEVRLDLVPLLEGSTWTLVNIALALAGTDAPPVHVRLEGTPTIDTPLGPIRYLQPVTIVSRGVGNR